MIGWATVVEFDDGSEDDDELGSILSTSVVKEEAAFFTSIPGKPYNK